MSTAEDNLKSFDNLTNQIILWESGELPEGETIELFQELVNSGLAWSLQGMYGRQAKAMIEAGLISLPAFAEQTTNL